MENLADLTEEQLNAMLAGDTGEQATEQEAIQQQGDITAEAQPTAEQIAAEQAAAVEAQAAPVEQQQAMQMVPLAALHEERRRRQQAEQLLNNPQALAQHLQQFGYQVAEPDALIDTDEAIRFHVAQAILPYQQENEQLRAYVSQIEHERQMERVLKDFGPEVAQLVPQLDQMRPDLAGLGPYEKAAMVTGAQWANPQYKQAQIEAEAKRLAEALVAEALAGTQKTTPVTLSGVPAAREEAPIAADQLSAKDMLGMSDDKLDQLLKGRG